MDRELYPACGCDQDSEFFIPFWIQSVFQRISSDIALLIINDNLTVRVESASKQFSTSYQLSLHNFDVHL